MILTTNETVPGAKVVTTLGLVRGNTVRARNVGRDILAALRGLVGGEISDYTKMMAEAREQALDRMMIEEARQLDANAIIGIGFSTSYIMASAAEILVFGTAATVEKQ